MTTYYDPVTGRPIREEKTYYDPETAKPVGRREVTYLTPLEEPRFRAWAQQSGIKDVDHPESYYDYRGLYKELRGKPVPVTPDRHFPDRYKQHGHPTFSVESAYSTGPSDGGKWNGETYAPTKPKPSFREAAAARLAAQGTTLARVKERAAAGKPIVESGLRTGSDAEQMGEYMLRAGEGLAKGTGAIGGLIVDAARANVELGKRAIGRGTKDYTYLGATGGVIGAVDEAADVVRRKTGLDGVEIGPAGEFAEAVTEFAAPGPEVVTGMRAASKGARSARAAAVPDDALRTAVRSATETTPADIIRPANQNAERLMNPPESPRIGDADARVLAEKAGQAQQAAADLPKYAEPSSINLERLNIDDDAKLQIVKTAKEVGPDLQHVKGAPLTHEEIIEAAKASEVLRNVTPRSVTLKRAGTILRTRQHLAALAEGKGIDPEFISTLKVMSSEATDAGRQLSAFAIPADPLLATSKEAIARKLLEIGVTADDIVKAADGVDFKDAKQTAVFYRKFVKPTLSEVIDEYRYINLLSSPKTHIVNAFSNLLQSTVLRPTVRLASGAIDAIGSKLTGVEREFYVSQVPAYYRGLTNSVGSAAERAMNALAGKSDITNLDLRHIPTNNPLLKPFYAIPRALEATDVFFRALVEGGELEALAFAAQKSGTAVDMAALQKQAAQTAAETVFRKELDPQNLTGQGTALATIDKLTSAIFKLREVGPVKWFIPFVQTPMNILKQGVEYSPLGFATLRGSTRKTEQLAKAMIGSTVFAGAGALALQGKTTWAPPRNVRDRAAFFDAGLQPYSVKIGDKWVSYTKLGPIAYPLAMASAAHYYAKENPKAVTDNAMEKSAKIFGGIAEFFSDQSYVEGLGRLLAAVRGEESAIANVATAIPQQLVPLVSLQRWITQIIDPVYRKADRGLSTNALIENIKKGIPGLSSSVPPYENPDGSSSERQFPVVNAFSPMGITEEDPEALESWRDRQDAARSRALQEAGSENQIIDPAQQEYLRKLMSPPTGPLSGMGMNGGGARPQDSGGGAGGGWAATSEIETAKKEMRERGITLEQSAKYLPGVSELLYKAIDPASDYDSPDLTKKALREFYQNITGGRTVQSGAAYGALEDAWSLYLGMPQKNGSFDVSDYRPSRAKGSVPYYFKINNFIDTEGGYFMSAEDRPETIRSIVESIADPRLRDDFGAIEGLNPALYHFQWSKGRDERGDYIAYYDKWDLAPIAKAQGRIVSVPIDKFIGGPIEIYDRIYYDPETFEPLE